MCTKLKSVYLIIVIMSFIFTIFGQDGTKIEAPRDKNGGYLPGLLMKIEISKTVGFELIYPKDIIIKQLPTLPDSLNYAYDNDLILVDIDSTATSKDSLHFTATGKISYLAKDPTKKTMIQTLGLRPTRIDITSLRNSGKTINYHSQIISPLAEGTSYLIIAWGEVVVINANLRDTIKIKMPQKK
jgi:hypothetical protein